MNQKALLPLALLLCCTLAGETASAANRALLISIGNYKDQRIDTLPGSREDLRLMQQITRSLGFAEQDIKVLAEEQAGLADIEREIETWLARGAGAQDRVLLYFSGHGTQVKDQNGDESDGLDEALVPYDTIVEKDETLLIDDRLNQLIGRIHAAETFVILDSCHSGTSTKGISLANDEYKRKFIHWPGIPPGLKGNFQVEPIGNGNSYVALAASRDHESAISGRKGSLFTLGLDKAVTEKSDKKLTVLEAKELAATFIANELRGRPRDIFNPAIDGDQTLAGKNLFLAQADAGGGGGGATGERSALWLELVALADKAGHKLDVVADKQHYVIGEQMQLSVTVKKSGYVNVINLGQDDALATALFPNRFVQDNYVNSGKTITLPGNGGTFKLTAHPPASDSLVVVFHTEKPLNLWKENIPNTKSIFTSVNTKRLRSFVVEAADSGAAATGMGAGILITRITDK